MVTVSTNEFVAVLEEYLFKSTGDRWVANYGPDIQFVVTVDEANKSVLLSNEKFQLVESIQHPRSKDFEKRFSIRLNRMKRKVSQLLRQQKKAKAAENAKVLLSTNYKADAPAVSIKSILRYHPLMRCDTCGRWMRDDFMKTDTQCLGCYEEEQEKKGSEC
jgi:hypothetical protein